MARPLQTTLGEASRHILDLLREPSDTNTGCRTTSTWSLTCASFPIRTLCRSFARLPDATQVGSRSGRSRRRKSSSTESRDLADLPDARTTYVRTRAILTISFGCTGGQHRSVMIAEEIKKRLAEAGYKVKVIHRDSRDVRVGDLGPFAASTRGSQRPHDSTRIHMSHSTLTRMATLRRGRRVQVRREPRAPDQHDCCTMSAHTGGRFIASVTLMAAGGGFWMRAAYY